MLSYAFLCNFGSFRSYYQWGGLPTELSSLLFLAIVWLSLTGADRRTEILRVLLFGNMILVHNLGAVIATAVMLFYVALTLLARQRDALAQCFVRLFPWTLLAFSFYIVPYAMRATGLESTDVLRYSDEAMMSWVDIARNLGYSVSALGVLGLLLHSRQASHSEDLLLLSWVTSLVLCFCILGYGYRLATTYMYGEDFSAFTPSRFLTVLSYPLAICAGYALSRLIRGATVLVRDRISLRADVLMTPVVLAIGAAVIPDVAELSERRTVAPGVYQVGASVTAQTPDNAFILYTPEAAKVLKPVEWLPYLTWRAAVYTPIPASEDRQTVREKRRLFRSGGSEIARWLAANGFEGYLVDRDSQGGFELTRTTFE